MINFLKRARNALWTFKQPLTMIPKDNQTVISDLFIWRCDDHWKTSFELLNIAYLFGGVKESQVNIVFFDTQGDMFLEKTINLLNGDRQNLDISKILNNNSNKNIIGKFGTFAVFHDSPPSIVKELNSFVAERGYVSYTYQNLPLSAYVHGNLDAIGKIGLNYIFLGGGLIKRSYNLQYQMLPEYMYSIALTNPCPQLKKIVIEVITIDNRRIIETFSEMVNPGAVIVCNLKEIFEPCRILIKSRMVMARPVIFSFKEGKMDVFHG